MSFEVREISEDLMQSSGGILASWFLANPNGPTAYALGYVEHDLGHDLFYRWLHFTGGKAWLIGSYEQDLDAFNEDIGAVIFNTLIRAHNEFQMRPSGDERPIMSQIPSFVITNGNSSVKEALAQFAEISLAAANWSQEIYLVREFGADLFRKAGWQFRETFERMRRTQDCDRNRIEQIRSQFQVRPGWEDWSAIEPPKVNADRSTIRSWLERVSQKEFTAKGLQIFAQMWVGAASQVAQTGLVEDLRESGRYTRFDNLSEFFDQYQMPLWRADWSDELIREWMGLPPAQ